MLLSSRFKTLKSRISIEGLELEFGKFISANLFVWSKIIFVKCRIQSMIHCVPRDSKLLEWSHVNCFSCPRPDTSLSFNLLNPDKSFQFEQISFSNKQPQQIKYFCAKHSRHFPSADALFCPLSLLAHHHVKQFQKFSWRVAAWNSSPPKPWTNATMNASKIGKIH